MRRSRLCAALTLCGLLAFATSAGAECAWVLWQYPYDPSKRLGMDDPRVVAGALPIATFGDRGPCLRAMVEAEGFNIPRLNDPSVKGMRPWYTLCFPDTIDPRAPKAQ
jgi:hypothetical protein